LNERIAEKIVNKSQIDINPSDKVEISKLRESPKQKLAFTLNLSTFSI